MGENQGCWESLLLFLTTADSCLYILTRQYSPLRVYLRVRKKVHWSHTSFLSHKHINCSNVNGRFPCFVFVSHFWTNARRSSCCNTEHFCPKIQKKRNANSLKLVYPSNSGTEPVLLTSTKDYDTLALHWFGRRGCRNVVDSGYSCTWEPVRYWKWKVHFPHSVPEKATESTHLTPGLRLAK